MLAPDADADAMFHFLPFLIVHTSLPVNRSTDQELILSRCSSSLRQMGQIGNEKCQNDTN
jgi:hypothetical protein